jgi:hypothetical protein
MTTGVSENGSAGKYCISRTADDDDVLHRIAAEGGTSGWEFERLLYGRRAAVSYPQRGGPDPGIFLTSASCSTSLQIVDFIG